MRQLLYVRGGRGGKHSEIKAQRTRVSYKQYQDRGVLPLISQSLVHAAIKPKELQSPHKQYQDGG